MDLFLTNMQRFTSHDGLESCGLHVDYCDVFISCLDSHSDGTHSLLRIHWWASDVMLNFSKSVPMKKQTPLHLGWPEGECIFGWTIPLIQRLFDVLWLYSILYVHPVKFEHSTCHYLFLSLSLALSDQCYFLFVALILRQSGYVQIYRAELCQDSEDLTCCLVWITVHVWIGRCNVIQITNQQCVLHWVTLRLFCTDQQTPPALDLRKSVWFCWFFEKEIYKV